MSTLTHDVTLLYCRSGIFLVWFISQCGTAQLRLSLFFLFSCATADIVIDVDGLDNIAFVELINLDLNDDDIFDQSEA